MWGGWAWGGVGCGRMGWVFRLGGLNGGVGVHLLAEDLAWGYGSGYGAGLGVSWCG